MPHLEKYYAVLKGREKARFLQTKSIEADFGGLRGDEELTDLHERLLSELPREMRDEEAHPNLLDLKVEISRRYLKQCQLCERRCGVDRSLGKKGKCGVTEPRVSTDFLHYGEEEPLVPSYTIFFSGCTFQCVFCQNYDISTRPWCGSAVAAADMAERIALVADPQRSSGPMTRARNVNWVGGEPTPNLSFILEVQQHLSINIPQVWNSNMFMTEESMVLLDGAIDVYLSDFKFGNDRCAKRLCNVDSYFEVVSRNHLMASQQAEVIVRHLVLPGHFECCTKPILEWIAENLSDADVNIMAQYHPEHRAGEYPEIARGLTRAEFEKAYRYALDEGLNLI